MKTILALALLGYVASTACAEVKASVNFTGSVWGTRGFELSKSSQRWDDLLTLSFSGQNAGASFSLYSNLENMVFSSSTKMNAAGTSSSGELPGAITMVETDPRVYFHYANLWFRPVDPVTLTLGYFEDRLYVEKLAWWKAPSAGSLTQVSGWSNQANRPWLGADTSDSAAGVKAGFTGIENLTLMASFTPGFFESRSDNYAAGYSPAPLVDPKTGKVDQTQVKYGAMAKYLVDGFGSVGASYRDDGWNRPKFAKVGFDFDGYEGLYAMLSLVGRIDNTALDLTGNVPSTQSMYLSGIGVDTYAAWDFLGFFAQIRLPYVIRLSGKSGDNNYFSYDGRLSYKIPEIPLRTYVRCQQDLIDPSVDQATPTINFGAELTNLDRGSFDVSLQFQDNNGTTQWSLPFSTRVSF